jgi:hypothetical protein
MISKRKINKFAEGKQMISAESVLCSALFHLSIVSIIEEIKT